MAFSLFNFGKSEGNDTKQKVVDGRFLIRMAFGSLPRLLMNMACSSQLSYGNMNRLSMKLLLVSVVTGQ